MATRMSLEDREKKRPTQKDLFKPTASDTVNQTSPENTNNDINNSITQNKVEGKQEKEVPLLKRQTYYVEPQTIKALGLKAVLEGRDKSEIVRAALEMYIEQKYYEIN